MTFFPPLSCFRRVVEEAEMSPFTQALAKHLKHKFVKNTPILVNDLHDQDNYVCHYSIFELVLKLGIKVKKIHRILFFNQRQYLKVKYLHMTIREREREREKERERERETETVRQTDQQTDHSIFLSYLFRITMKG